MRTKYPLKVLLYFTSFTALVLLVIMLIGSVVFWREIFTAIQPRVIQMSNPVSTFIYSSAPQLFWIGVLSAIIYAAINWAAYFINLILELRNETN